MHTSTASPRFNVDEVPPDVVLTAGMTATVEIEESARAAAALSAHSHASNLTERPDRNAGQCDGSPSSAGKAPGCDRQVIDCYQPAAVS